ncbi:MAG: hypothetical protein AAFX99_19370, partial [Myxococcota bacterium]
MFNAHRSIRLCFTVMLMAGTVVACGDDDDGGDSSDSSNSTSNSTATSNSTSNDTSSTSNTTTGTSNATGDTSNATTGTSNATTGTSNATSTSNATTDGPPFGSAEDVAQAEAIWGEIDETYSGWALFPGTFENWPSAAPHGERANIYVSTEFLSDPADPPADATIVKENLDGEGEIAAWTIMRKIDGFNPDEDDWFWMKLLPDGSLDVNGAGVPLAGAVGKGGDMGCIPCHAGAGGDDFLFTNDAVAGTAGHAEYANTVWDEIDETYSSWALFPGTLENWPSAAPH